MLEAYRALVASRQAKLLQQLTAMGMVSARMGRLLAKTRLVNPDFIPDMPEKPLLPPGLVEALAAEARGVAQKRGQREGPGLNAIPAHERPAENVRIHQVENFVAYHRRCC